MDRGAWKATVHGVSKSRIWLKRFSMHAHMRIYVHTCVRNRVARLDEAQKRRRQPSTHQDKDTELVSSLRHMWCDLTQCLVQSTCSSDWNFLSRSQPIRPKMPSSGVGWGDIRDFPRSALCHFIITLIQAEDTPCLSSSLTAAKIDSKGPRFDSIICQNQVHHQEVQELFSLGF